MTTNLGSSPAVRFVSKSLTFTGASTLGLINTNATFFTVTGEVNINLIVPFCTDDLTGAASTVQLGVTGSLTLFIAATTATTIDTNLFWVSATPTGNGIAVPAALKDIVITDDILVRSLAADTTGGTLRIDCYWTPLSANGNVVAA